MIILKRRVIWYDIENFIRSKAESLDHRYIFNNGWLFLDYNI